MNRFNGTFPFVVSSHHAAIKRNATGWLLTERNGKKLMFGNRISRNIKLGNKFVVKRESGLLGGARLVGCWLIYPRYFVVSAVLLLAAIRYSALPAACHSPRRLAGYLFRTLRLFLARRMELALAQFSEILHDRIIVVEHPGYV